MFGGRPALSEWRLLGIAIPLFALSLAGLWLTYLPLSFFAPQFVSDWVLNDQMALIVPNAPVRNALTVVEAVVLAPVVEEFLFRGLLLHRWAHRWGVRRGVLLSSAAFAVVHVEVLGGLVFALVMAMLYVRTRSLWTPILCHAAHNGLVVLVAAGGVFLGDGASTPTLAQFQAEWWTGVLGFCLGAPLLWAYLRRYRPEPGWALPYPG